MNVLVINAGSSSIKYQLINMDDEGVIAKGLIERIGIEGANLVHKVPSRDDVKIEKPMKNHVEAIAVLMNTLLHPAYGVIKSMEEVHAVGHRVVHGGEAFSSSRLITDDVMASLRDNCDLAPLHNPANIIGIEACMDIMPGVPQVGVFDTAFHQTMPKKAYLYALPIDYYKRLKVRRYGFHGTSHFYVANRAAEMLKRPIEELKIITCHIGNGGSITAVDGGKSVDTSMGLTPLEGLVMGTRTGDIDPAITEFLMKKENMSVDEVMAVYNKKSGLLGMSGVSSDMRDITVAVEAGHEDAQAALSVFVYRIKKYIGAYAAAMGGLDCLVFTGGIGENVQHVRKSVLEGLEFLGIEFDEARNHARGQDVEITKDGSRVKVLTIATNEELVIARDTLKLAEKR